MFFITFILGGFMSKINFSDGSLSGKLGKIVGASWKGIPYTRLYEKPKDPKSDKQLAIRQVFRNTAHIASKLSMGVLKPYTFPQPARCTAYGHMLHLNRLMFTNKEWNPENLKILEGPLENTGITSAVLTGKTMKVSFDAAKGKGYDTAIAVVYDEVSRGVFHATGLRSDGFVNVSFYQKLSQDKASLHAYLAFARAPSPYTEEKGLVSITAYKKVEWA
jgi:hypothetical protein